MAKQITIKKPAKKIKITKPAKAPFAPPSKSKNYV